MVHFVLPWFIKLAVAVYFHPKKCSRGAMGAKNVVRYANQGYRQNLTHIRRCQILGQREIFEFCLKKYILFLIFDFLVTENILLMDKNICRLCSVVNTTLYVSTRPLTASEPRE